MSHRVEGYCQALPGLGRLTIEIDAVHRLLSCSLLAFTSVSGSAARVNGNAFIVFSRWDVLGGLLACREAWVSLRT